MRHAVFPGSFDPITLGHVDIIRRALPFFDELTIAVGINTEKKYMFSLQQRMEFIQKTFQNEPAVKVVSYKGLTVDFCKATAANLILRGLRNPADFEFEKAVAHINQKLSGIETLFLLTAAETASISSSIVREIIKNNGDYTLLVPDAVRI